MCHVKRYIKRARPLAHFMKKPIIIMGKKRVYEIPFNSVTLRKVIVKKEGIESAKESDSWQDFVPKFSCFKSIIITEKGTSLELDSIILDSFLKDIIIKNEKEENILCSIDFFIDFNYIFEHLLLLDYKCKQEVLRKASSIKLPLTSAHGDLHIENIIITKDGSLKLIDWEYFRKNNSVILDILHFYVRELCRQKNVNWVEAIQYKELNSISIINNYVYSCLSVPCVR